MLVRKVLFSELFIYETLITFYTLLMLGKVLFGERILSMYAVTFQRKIHIRFLAAAMDLENGHINSKLQFELAVGLHNGKKILP